MASKPVRDGLVVQVPDVHVPDEHPRALANLTRFIADVQPAAVVFTGDFADFLSVARWSADTLAEDGAGFQRELDKCDAALARIRDVSDCPMHFIRGNHEKRIEKWGRTRGKGVWGLRALTVPSLLGLADKNIAYHEDGPYEFAAGCIAIHGEKLGQKAGLSVSKELDRFGNQRSIAMGHCHRLAVTYRQAFGRALFGVEAGHLMDQRKADYLSYGTADWQLGFAVYQVEGRSTVPQVIPVAQNGSFTFEGVRWS